MNKCQQKHEQYWLFKIIIFLNALAKYQGAKEGFAIHELRSVFAKLQIEISNFVENFKSTFFDD